MAKLSLNGSRLIVAFLLISILSALLGWAAANWQTHKVLEEKERERLETQVYLRCYAYWGGQSGTADAESEFRHGRKGLLQVTKTFDPVLEVWSPGLRKGRTAEVRPEFPLKGPRFDDLPDNFDRGWSERRACNPTNYAWDYNTTMLRLLGRPSDIDPPLVSPELNRASR